VLRPTIKRKKTESLRVGDIVVFESLRWSFNIVSASLYTNWIDGVSVEDEIDLVSFQDRPQSTRDGPVLNSDITGQCNVFSVVLRDKDLQCFKQMDSELV
jgi:hypothetical protein